MIGRCNECHKFVQHLNPVLLFEDDEEFLCDNCLEKEIKKGEVE